MNVQGLFSPGPSPENIAAVIVTYYPDSKFAERLGRVSDQGVFAIVVDNTPGRAAEGLLHRVSSSTVEVLRNGENRGLATALNQGIRRAAELGYAWSLLLDQDTIVDLTLVTGLIEAYNAYSGKQLVAVIGPNARSKVSGRLLYEFPNNKAGVIEVKSIVTSGSLLSVQAYSRVGPFRDDFFIEGIDLEYCLRLRKCGFSVLCTRAPLMTHVGGKGIERRFITRIVLIPGHEPWRYRFMFRNLVVIVRQYWWDEFMLCALLGLNVIKLIIKLCLYEENKASKIRAILSGIKDGVMSKQRVSQCGG
ncbi:MAG TPA: glycosyltransferase [Nitrospiraceae bacterium]|jgi:rhamnosyltransferase|nr:glycosyltransferase [Nitrospiraceae bacterium]